MIAAALLDIVNIQWHKGLTPQCFPRTRGDVPSPAASSSGWRSLPPHTRGCTRDRPELRDVPVASPAHAGMYPDQLLNVMMIEGFPRTRGDVPTVHGTTWPHEMLPPHTRGCTVATLCAASAPVASPAHAGMYPDQLLNVMMIEGFPRTRGDVPPTHRGRGRRRRLPPHTRGCTGRMVIISPPPRASPAHAGMYPGECPAAVVGLGFPRTRGDVPFRNLPARSSGYPR